MKRNLMPLIAVAFVAAVAATGIFYGLLLPRLGKPAAVGNSMAVVVAAKPLSRGHVLQPDDVAAATVPEGWKSAEGFADKELVVGLTLLQPVGAKEPITRSAVSPRGQVGGVSLAVPPGMRAVTIHPVGSAGIVSLLDSGSRIDIHAVDMRAKDGPQLRRLMDDVEVLGKAGDSGHPEVTVVAAVDAAERLLLADSSLPLRITLRNPGDRAQQGQTASGPAGLPEQPRPETRVRASLQ